MKQSSEDVDGWSTGDALLSLLLMYEATDHTAYLDRFVSDGDLLLTLRDSERGVTDYRGLSLPAWRSPAYYSAGTRIENTGDQALLLNPDGRPTLSLVTDPGGLPGNNTVTVQRRPNGRFDILITLDGGSGGPQRLRYRNLTMDPTASTPANGRYAPYAFETSARPWNRRFQLFDLGLPGPPADRAPAAGETTLTRGRYHYVQQTGSLAHPLARFARMVRESPTLNAVPAYAERAATYLAAAEDAVAIHDDEWRENSCSEGWYIARVGSPLWYQGLDHGYNKLAMLGLALIELASATDEQSYRRKAAMLATTLRNDMVHVEDADAYRWPFYWSSGPSYPLNPRWEDVSHAGATVLFAFTAYRSAIVFTGQDMRRLANTWTRVIAPSGAGDAVAYRVSGEGMGDGHPSVVRRGWALLGLFEDDISRFAERWFTERGSTTDIRQRLLWASLAWILTERASDGKVREK